MYPKKNSVPTKRQQIGDEAEKERNTVFKGANDNSIRVNDLIDVYW